MGGSQPDREAARPPKRPFPRLLAVLAVVAVGAVGLVAILNSGSGNGDENNGQDSKSVSGGGTSGQDAGTISSSPADQDGCTEEYGQDLTVATNDPREVPYLEQIVACTNAAESATLLVNNSDTVWTLSTTQAGATVTQLSNTPRLLSFREALARVYEYPVLAPESSLIVHAAPSRTSWTLNPGYSAMWLAHEQFADTVQKYGENQLTDMLSGQSLRRKALITCSIASYHVAGDKAENLVGPNPTEQLLAGLGVASEGTQCARAWLQADDEAARRFGSTATWRDDIARLADNTRFIQAADERLTALHNFGKLIARVAGS